MDTNYAEMSLEELKAERLKLEDELDEYRDEREMMLGQTGQHISSTSLSKRYAKLISKTEEKIAEIDALINGK